MKVYKAEAKLGLTDLIKANSSIAYTLSPATLGKKDSVSIASIEDPDVYHNYSILVSTVWNRNDDVFLKDEVWAARNTPVGKPTNLNHDEKLIVGNMQGVWPVDPDFKRISENIAAEDLPDYYHLLVSSVIYRQWEDPELKSRAENLISKIEAGEMCVSMECLFKDFDYAIQNAEGKHFIVERNESTAAMTAHLRSYGGDGKYGDNKIGRAIRRLTFSGKGYVENPANPDSVVFNKDMDFAFSGESHAKMTTFKIGSVSNNVDNDINNNLDVVSAHSDNPTLTKDKVMSDNAKLESQLEAAQAKIEELQDAVSKANVAGLEKQIAELTEAADADKAALEAAQTELADVKSKLEASETNVTDVAGKLAEAVEAKEKIEAEMEDMKKKEKKDKRVAQLVEAGLEKEEADAKASLFETLSDDQFDAIVSLSIAKKDEDKKDVKKDDEADASEESDDVDASVVTTASEDEEEADLAAGSEVEDEGVNEKAQADIAKFINSRFNIEGDE